MKYDEFAFFNQQLAAMLREGIPLEGALAQLCVNLRDGELRREVESLQADLQSGTPIKQALALRKLPDLYVEMVKVGVDGNDLPGMLLMLADYYQRVDSTWTRLKGLMVYPFIVLVTSFGLSCFFTYFAYHLIDSGFSGMMGVPTPPRIFIGMWIPPMVIGTLLLAAIIMISVPMWRRKLRWRLPGFKEAKLAQVATAMGLMLKNGGNLGDALGLVEQMERNTIASGELARWHAQLANGRGQFSEMAAAGPAFPPLFLWMVSNAGEDLSAGFRRAAEIYHARALHRIDLFLYAALPTAILGLGGMICLQIFPVIRNFLVILGALSS
ncbi:MAG TPA: type II secretion system F family protein [Verrucomicrobiae bacterium]|jgi:type II secretory pathway component PulF|nr:type II secretion system F family protein [Verrucomicrobiae bacterium]